MPTNKKKSILSRLRGWARNKSEARAEASKKKRLERRRKRMQTGPITRQLGQYGARAYKRKARQWKSGYVANEKNLRKINQQLDQAGREFNFSDKRKSRSRSKRTSRCRRVKSGPRKGRCYKTRSRSKRTSRRRRISYERPRARSRSRRRCRRVKSGPRKGRCYKTRSRRRRSRK